MKERRPNGPPEGGRPAALCVGRAAPPLYGSSLARRAATTASPRVCVPSLRMAERK